MAKTTAAAMARSIGVDPQDFRQALRERNFSWRPVEGAWIVEVGSPEHLEMIRVLKKLFANAAKPAAASETKSAAKSNPTAKRKEPAKKPAARKKGA